MEYKNALLLHKFILQIVDVFTVSLTFRTCVCISYMYSQKLFRYSTFNITRSHLRSAILNPRNCDRKYTWYSNWKGGQCRRSKSIAFVFCFPQFVARNVVLGAHAGNSAALSYNVTYDLELWLYWGNSACRNVDLGFQMHSCVAVYWCTPISNMRLVKKLVRFVRGRLPGGFLNVFSRTRNEKTRVCFRCGFL